MHEAHERCGGRQSRSFPEKPFGVTGSQPFEVRFSLIHSAVFLTENRRRNSPAKENLSRKGGGEEKERERECVFLPARAR